MLRNGQQPVMATVKSRLAQLLAQEDIKVQHLPTKTAYFDMQNRVLICPIWKDMDGDLYDLCMGHEVGHALNTPAEGWHGALVQMGKGYQTYMNVVEDARIERKIKSMFPGLRAPFARAYKKMDERDMFGIREKNLVIDKLGLIDRLNVYYKLGHVYHVTFTAEERSYIDRIDRADTWEQVREIADELYARAKKNKDKLPEMPQQEGPQTESDCQDDEQDQNQSQNKSTKSSKQSKSNKKDKDSDKDDGKKGKNKKDKKSKKGKSKDESEMTDEELAESIDKSNAGERPEDDENEYDDEDEDTAGDSDSDEDGDESDEDGDADDSDGDADGDEGSESDGDSDEDGDDADAGGEGEETDTDADGDDSGNAEGESDGEVEPDRELDDKAPGRRAQDSHKADDHDQQGGQGNDDFLHDENEKPEVPDPTSITDEAFRQAEKQLVDTKAQGIRTCYLPGTDNVDKMIAPIELIYTSIEDGVAKGFRAYKDHWGPLPPEKTPEAFAKLASAEILQDNKKYIDMLVKEFELRKNASQYARQLTAKTGELDVNRLHQYKFTSDLFRKVTTVQQGKNHGMVFFLDMSSSMQGIMGYTVKQLLILVTFCKRVGIPFDVYGFADGSITGFRPARFQWGPDTIQTVDRSFHLKHLISSSLRGNEFRRAFAALAMYSNCFYGQQSEAMRSWLMHQRYAIPFSDWDMNMCLSGTPYNKMLLASREIIEKFRMTHRVDIVNVIHLTDGDGTDHCTAPPEHNLHWNDPNYHQKLASRIAYTDRKTMMSIIAEPSQSSQEVLTLMVKQITGCRHIAFYVADPNTIQGYLHVVDNSNGARAKARESLKDYGFFKAPHLGYDNYYYMGVDGSAKTTISNNENIDIAERFITAQKNKGKIRSMARSFATEIAEQVQRDR